MILQLTQPLVQALVALHQQVGLIGLEELTSFGLRGALQILPALPDLLQLLPDNRAEFGLLLDQVLTLLDVEGGEKVTERQRQTDRSLVFVKKKDVTINIIIYQMG